MAERWWTHVWARQLLAATGGCVCAAVLAAVVFSVQYSGDYSGHNPVGGDNAAPGIAALLHGNLHGYLEHQPIIGLTSILLRLPFVAIAVHLGARGLDVYTVGAFACVLTLALLAAWMLAEATLTPSQRLVRLLAVLLVIQSPIFRNAIESGHPEGVVSSVLDVAAVLAAMRGRARWAALLLGLAIAAKESGVIALPPVLIALPGRRREVSLIGAGVVILFVCSGWIAEPSAFLRAVRGEGHTRFLTPLSVLWPLGHALPLANGQRSLAHVIPWGLTRTGATLLTLSVVSIPAAWWYLRARGRRAKCDPLALLALLGVLRCFCDSTHEMYYYLSVLIPLAAWEALDNRVPLVTALTSLSVSWVYSDMGRLPGYDLYLVCTAVALILMFCLARRAMTRRAEGASVSRVLSLGARELTLHLPRSLYAFGERRP